MIKVSAAEFQRNIGRYHDLTLTQPVAVARNGRERTVMISIDEYHRLKGRDRQVNLPALQRRYMRVDHELRRLLTP
jgi:PHD/YefM family antitoxin component YafN of YafNO toxin-antitoxin module